MLTLITKLGCEQCEQIKRILTVEGIGYKEIYGGIDIPREEIKQKYPQATTYPIILDKEDKYHSYLECMEMNPHELWRLAR